MGNLPFEFRVPSRELRTRNRKIETRNRVVALGFLFLLMVSGCGYQFSSRADGVLKDVQTLYIEPFVNRSREVGIDWEVTLALKSEFFRRGEPRIVDRVEEADAVLAGVVRSLDNRVLAVNRHDEVLLYEATLVVDLNLRRRNPDKLLWRGQQIRLAENYSGSRGAVVITSPEFKTGTLNASDLRDFTDIQLTEAMATSTREQLVRRLARQLHQRLLNTF